MNLNTRIKLKLDPTILQSNTGIDLVSFIIKQRDIILEMKDKYESTNVKKAKVLKASQFAIISDAYERIIKNHTEALHRRVGRVKYDKDWLDS